MKDLTLFMKNLALASLYDIQIEAFENVSGNLSFGLKSYRMLFEEKVNRYLEFMYGDEFKTYTAEINTTMEKDGLKSSIKDHFFCVEGSNTENKFLFEFIHHGEYGNAYQKCYRYFPGGGIVKSISDSSGYDYIPIACIFSGDILSNERCTLEIALQFEDYPDHYFFWEKCSDELLIDFIEQTVIPRIRGEVTDF